MLMHANVVDQVFSELHEIGHFYDPVEREVAEAFIPWLLAESSTQLSNVSLSHDVANKLVAKALLNKMEAMVSFRKVQSTWSSTVFSHRLHL